ncbi:hypothetical protein [Desertivirga xinjiangensis]|uniref:hypothetical protein n=1 Tax=Desertivirga xinjiangensis TaxID=539206 RepID=UPI00210DAB3E|nr:hypothetical protein [Pedobacter xinjiangensis]
MRIDYTKEIQELQTEIKEAKSPDSAALIKQTFIIWYLLVEGNTDIEEDYLQQLLNRNMVLINKFYSKKPELLFLQGWMIKISPWHFNLESDDIGDKYLKLAYKYNPDNLLFKWALPEESHMTKTDAERLEASILENLNKFYINYRPIQEYFQNVVGRK